jgi:hypothetical protein
MFTRSCGDRVLKEVLWFATEVPRKYATRYRSVAAWELQRKGMRVGEWAGLVAHEHVWTRATCRIDCCPRRMRRRSSQ